MRPIVQEHATRHNPESLAAVVRNEPGLFLLQSGLLEAPGARYSLAGTRPFLTFRSWGSRCELRSGTGADTHFGNPWSILEALLSRFEMLEELDLPFPLGGCFGFWGYDLKNFVEPRLPRRAVNDLELPDCCVGFYGSLVVFDHRLGKTWIIATGMQRDGSRDPAQARAELAFWQERLEQDPLSPGQGLPWPGADDGGERTRSVRPASTGDSQSQVGTLSPRSLHPLTGAPRSDDSFPAEIFSHTSRDEFLAMVRQAQDYIRLGHIYQVNLSQRLEAEWAASGWEFYSRLSAVSPAPFGGYFDAGDFQIISSSPECFVRLSGGHIRTRPIKGTRPRSVDPLRDAQLAYELQTSAKETAELIMITDLLRNDLGRVCEFGSVQAPELMRLERYPHVQHLVSTVEGRLRGDITHLAALARCFPGGSITGAPKIRAMEIIDELEPLTRGPYTGCFGYVGFNRESQLSILIRTAICRSSRLYFQVGAGIVDDSVPEAEYEETLAKAGGFLAALQLRARAAPRVNPK